MGPNTLQGGHSVKGGAGLFLTHGSDGLVDWGIGLPEAVEDTFPHIGAHRSHTKLVNGHEGVGVAADVLCSEPIMSHDLGDRLLDHHTGSLRREDDGGQKTWLVVCEDDV